MSTPPTNVDQYIARLQSPMQDIVIELRRIINESSTELTESIKWNVPVYSVRRNICSVIAHKSHVNLQIFQGAHLSDAHLLTGTGADMRHLKLSGTEDIHRDVILRCLQQAITLDSRKRTDHVR